MGNDQQRNTDILRLFQQNYQLLSSLYPEKTATLTELSTVLGQELGNLSKTVAKLAEAGLLRTEMEKGRRGKRKRIQLSSLSVKMISGSNNIIENELKKVNYVDSQLLDVTFKLLDSSNEEIRRDGVVRLSRETAKAIFPDEKYIIKLKGYIFDSKISDTKELLQTLINLARNSEEVDLNVLDRHFRDPLTKQLQEATGKSDKEKGRWLQILTALTEILPYAKCYDVLVDSYIAHIRERSDYAARIRGLLKAKFPDKVNEVKIMLTKLLPESSTEIGKFIMNELDQL